MTSQVIIYHPGERSYLLFKIKGLWACSQNSSFYLKDYDTIMNNPFELFECLLPFSRYSFTVSESFRLLCTNCDMNRVSQSLPAFLLYSVINYLLITNPQISSLVFNMRTFLKNRRSTSWLINPRDKRTINMKRPWNEGHTNIGLHKTYFCISSFHVTNMHERLVFIHDIWRNSKQWRYMTFTCPHITCQSISVSIV